MRPARRPSIARRLMGRLLTAAFPGEFRRQFGREMLEVSVARAREVRASRGRLAWVRCWLRTVADLTGAGLAARRERRRADERAGGARGDGVARGLLADVRYAVRGFRHNPGFTAVAVLTLALGIGANTAMFSVLDAVLLEPLPYPAPDRLARVDFDRPLTVSEFVALERETSAFAGLGGSSSLILTVGGDGPAEEVGGARAIGDLFGVLGARAAAGRLLRADDGRPGAAPVAVISDRYWHERFGGDPAAVGRSVEIGGAGAARRTIVGVVDRRHVPLEAGCDIWVPVVVDPADEEAYDHDAYLNVVGRLAPGMTLAIARTQVQALAGRRARTEAPAAVSEAAASADVVTLQDFLVRNVRVTALLLAAAVGLVLVMAAVNVTSLWLARVGGRGREMAVRRALGASRGRLVRQVLTESAVLSLAGGAAGVWLGQVAAAALGARLTAAVPGAEARIDARVLLFTFGVALVVGVASGLVPALRATRDQALAPGGGRRQSLGRGQARTNRRLVSAEVALAVVLVAAAGLLLRSLDRVQRTDPGFDPARILSLRLRPPAARYPDPPRLQAYYREAIQTLAALPAVEAAGAINLLPLGGSGMSVGYCIDGHCPSDGVEPLASYRIVEPGYFAAMGIAVRAGRALAAADVAGTPPVAVVNESLARAIAGDGGAVGRRFTDGAGHTWLTVVGVVRDIRQSALERRPRPEVYVPAAQALEFMDSMFLTLRTAGDPEAAVPAVLSSIRRLDDQVPVSAVRPMRHVVAASLRDRRLLTGLFALFGAVALALGAAGVYGVLAQAVGARTREIGIRMAVGASRADVRRWAVREGVRPAVWGIGAGLATALPAGMLFRSQLVDAAPVDPVVLLSVAGLLLAVAAAASWLPARRASRVDPIEVLKAD